MNKKIAYVGIDYHMDLLSVAVMIEGAKKIYDTIRLANKDKVMDRGVWRYTCHLQVTITSDTGLTDRTLEGRLG